MLELPSHMTVIGFSTPGGPYVLRPETRPVPCPRSGEILIHVAAAGINRPDVFQRMGLYPPPPGAPDYPGLEIAGTVVETGVGTSRYKTGDRVCALVAGGGYADYAIANEELVLPSPANLSNIESAALPETVFTVWSNLFDIGRLQAGEWLLVHGGSSGIGTIAIQMAKAFGAQVIATAGSDEKCTACLKLGADRAVNYRNEDFVAIAKDITGGKGVNLTLDMVGGSYVRRNYEASAMDGRIVQIATLLGAKAEVDVSQLMRKRLWHTGSTLRPRPLSEKAAIAAAVEKNIWPLIASGKIRPVLHKVLPLAEAAEAHRLMETSDHIGKIMLLTGR